MKSHTKYYKIIIFLATTIYYNLNAITYSDLPSIEINLDGLKKLSKKNETLFINEKITVEEIKNKDKLKIVEQKKDITQQKTDKKKNDKPAKTKIVKPLPAKKDNKQEEIKSKDIPKENYIKNDSHTQDIKQNPKIIFQQKSEKVINNKTLGSEKNLKENKISTSSKMDTPKQEAEKLDNKKIEKIPSVPPQLLIDKNEIVGSDFNHDIDQLPAFENKPIETHKLINLPEPIIQDNTKKQETNSELYDTNLPIIDSTPTIPTLAPKGEIDIPLPPGIDEINLQNTLPTEEKSISNNTKNAIENHIRLSFSKNDFKLDNNLKSILNKIVSSVKDSKENRLRIIGFGDNDSLIKPNDARKIALQRVIGIRKYLIENGLNSENINVQAVGKDVKDNSIGRVDIFVESND